MDKKYIENELNKIFKLIKACKDKDYLQELCNQRGVTADYEYIKMAKQNEEEFENVFKGLLKVGSSPETLVETIKKYSSFDFLSKTVRIKKDPTQKKLLTKEEEEEKERVRNVLDKKDRSKGVGSVWDRAFLMIMESRYGKWDKSTKSFVNKDGEPVVTLGEKGMDSIQSYVYGMVSRMFLPKGWTNEDIADEIMTRFWYGGEGSKKIFTDYIDKYLEDHVKEGKKLPLNIGGLIVKRLRDSKADLMESLGRASSIEDQIESSKYWVDKWKKDLSKLDDADDIQAMKQKIEQEEKKIDRLEKDMSSLHSDSPTDSDSIQKHPFVKTDITPSGEIIHFSEEMVDLVADLKDELGDLLTKSLREDFEIFLKSQNDPKSYKVFKIVIDHDINITEKDEIRDILKEEDASSLNFSSTDMQTIPNKIKNYLAEFAVEEDNVDLLEAMKKMNVLPRSFDKSISEMKNKKSSSVENISSYIKVIASRLS